MKKTMLNIKIDSKLKSQAKKTAEALGIPLSTIASALLRQFVRDKEINLSIELKPSKYLIDAIEESRKEYLSGKSESYNSMEELFNGLKI